MRRTRPCQQADPQPACPVRLDMARVSVQQVSVLVRSTLVSIGSHCWVQSHPDSPEQGSKLPQKSRAQERSMRPRFQQGRKFEPTSQNARAPDVTHRLGQQSCHRLPEHEAKWHRMRQEGLRRAGNLREVTQRAIQVVRAPVTAATHKKVKMPIGGARRCKSSPGPFLVLL